MIEREAKANTVRNSGGLQKKNQKGDRSFCYKRGGTAETPSVSIPKRKIFLGGSKVGRGRGQ